MKKLMTAVVALALALTVVAPVAASAQTSATYTFSTNLKVGSRGADVVALQSLLESKGFLKIPAGVAKGYFGSATRSAVAAYQVSKGITPAAGFFGPMTRAAASAEGSVVVAPGTPTTPTTPITNTGVEGTVDVRLAPAPANNANVQTSVDVPVYGVEFKARLADVAVQTLDLQVDVRNSGNSENPSTLINTIKVMDGSTVVATIPVTSSTFTKDSNQVYYVRIPSINFVVAKDTTKTLTVAFSTNSIDSDRVVTIDGYNANSVRTVSGNGVNSFYSIDGSNYSRVHTFKKPGTSTLTVSAVGNPLRSTNSKINPTSGVQGSTLLNFNVKSETGDSKVLTVFASTTGVAPSTLYLYDGSTLVDSRSGAANVVFQNLEIAVAKDQIKTLTIKADYPSSVASAASTTVTVQHVAFETPNGSTNTQAGPVAGVPHYVFSKAAQYTISGNPTVSTVSDTNGKTTSVLATFNLKVQALGGNVVKPSASDFTVVFASSSVNTPFTATNVSVTVNPNNNVGDGSTADVTVTASLNTSSGAASSTAAAGLYTPAITSISWDAGNGAVAQTWGLDDFKSPTAANVVR